MDTGKRMSGTGGLRKGMHRTTRRFSCTGYIFLVIVLLALAGPHRAEDHDSKFRCHHGH